MDRILINGIKVFAHHGVLPEERERGQDFHIDIALELDLTEAAESDDLSATVDYAAVAESVAGLASTVRYDLIETLAAAIADHILSFDRVRRVEVMVRKPEAPLAVPVGWVGVSVSRERGGGAADGDMRSGAD